MVETLQKDHQMLYKMTAIGRMTAIGYRPATGCNIYSTKTISYRKKIVREVARDDKQCLNSGPLDLSFWSFLTFLHNAWYRRGREESSVKNL